MPELPEVESIRLGLQKSLRGKVIRGVEVITGKIVSGSGNLREDNKIKREDFVKNIINKRITDIKRRAKNLILELEDSSIVLVHLKMTGQLIYKSEAPEISKHTHIVFTLDDGYLLYNDVRKFGYVLHYANLADAINTGHFHKIGLEPFDKNFTLEYFRLSMQKKNKNLKSVLLDQEIVVGCGNIYADEICFASHVSPTRISNTLTNIELERLYENIISILSLAIRSGGSSISDYRLADGSKGSYARHHKVYGRAGLPCYDCNNILDKSLIANRTTVYCNTCQL